MPIFLNRNSEILQSEERYFLARIRTKGPSTGDSFKLFPVRAWNYVLVERGHATAVGIRHVVASGGPVTVRVRTQSRAREPWICIAVGEG